MTTHRLNGCVALSVFAWLLAACESQPNTAVAAAAVDDVDPAIVVNNPAPDTTIPAFRISAEPVIRVGGRSDANLNKELWVVVDAVLNAVGQLIVIMDAGREIRVFDRDSQFVRTIGRIGEGPGEFRTASRLVSLGGDTLLLYDARLRRITGYLPDARYPLVSGNAIDALCCFSDGAFLRRSTPARAYSERSVWPEPPGMMEWSIAEPWTQFSESRPILKLRESDPSARIVVQGVLDGFVSRIPPQSAVVPFSRTATVRIIGDQIIYGHNDRYEYRVFSRDGNLLRVVRAALPIVPVTSSDLAAARKRFTANRVYRRGRPDSVDVSRWYARAFPDLELPRTMPAYSRIMGEEDGTVWVQNYSPPWQAIPRLELTQPGASWWSRFDADGRLHGTMQLPEGHNVVRFTRGHVILRYDEPTDGFTILTVHRIELTRR